MTSVIEMIMAKATVRMNEALERLKAKIVSKLSEEVVEELGDINVSSFAKKSLKALEQDMIDIKTKGEEEEGTAPKAKKAKSSKDPNAPKGAKNAYIIFCADNRNQVKTDNPEMNAKEIISELARLWKEADEDVKAEYQEKATEDKKRYQEEMSDYASDEDEAKKVESPKKGSKKAGSEAEAKKVESPKKGSKKGSKEAEVEKVESPKKGSKKGSKEAEVEKVESPKKGSKKGSKAKKSDE